MANFLDRETALAQTRNIRGLGAPILLALTDWGAEIFERCSGTAPNGEEDLGILMPLHHLVEMLDGIEVLLDCLVVEAPDHLVMAPALPRAWQGASVDARSLVTRHGVLSFSLRWHDARPAVLWELQAARAAGSPGPAMRCGLDESWASAAPSGEALLGIDPWES